MHRRAFLLYQAILRCFLQNARYFQLRKDHRQGSCREFISEICYIREHSRRVDSEALKRSSQSLHYVLTNVSLPKDLFAIQLPRGISLFHNPTVASITRCQKSCRLEHLEELDDVEWVVYPLLSERL